MKVLVDTNIISHVLREREPVLSRFTEALGTENVFLSSDVVDYEIRRYLVLKDAKRQLERYEALSRDWLSVGGQCGAVLCCALRMSRSDRRWRKKPQNPEGSGALNLGRNRTGMPFEEETPRVVVEER